MSTPVLHLGLGRFHRAHQCDYFQRMNDEAGDGRWTVTSFSMRSSDARDRLRAAGLRYPVVETSRAGVKARWIDRVREVGSIVEDLETFTSAMRDPEIEIVTLTITEKGYGLDVSGELDLEAPAMKADLANPTRPKSAIGVLALGLAERAKSPPAEALTILSCDNLRSNGAKLERAVHRFLEASERHEALAFVRDNVRFPSTMVDRIVPALGPDLHRKFEAEAGIRHPELVATETFSQWVIEDRFARPRPAWDRVGVEFVQDVKPYEEMKLRLLNAAHSFLAYSGLLRGHSFVHEAVADPELRQWLEELLYEEAGPCLPKGLDYETYSDRLIERFENQRLPHSLKQIAADGSQKIPQRILPTIEESIRLGRPSPACDMAVFSWLSYLHRELGPDSAAGVDDPQTSRLKGLWSDSFTKWLKMTAADERLFGPLARNPTWHDRLARAND